MPGSEYEWFFHSDVTEDDWCKAKDLKFPHQETIKLRYKALESYVLAYEVDAEQAASSLRSVVAEVLREAQAVEFEEWWMVRGYDGEGFRHRFLFDFNGETVVRYAPPSWEERMGIPVPQGKALSVAAIRSLDTTGILASKDLLKKYTKVAHLQEKTLKYKLNHLRTAMKDVLSDPSTEVFLNDDDNRNVSSYVIRDNHHDVVWLIRSDGRYIFSLFSKKKQTDLFQGGNNGSD